MNNEFEWLKESYVCPGCGEGIGNAFSRGDYRDNPHWLAVVMSFTREHRDHGFSLDDQRRTND